MFKVSLPTAALVIFLSVALSSSAFAQIYSPPPPSPSPAPSGGTAPPPSSPTPSGGTTTTSPSPTPSGGSTTPAPTPAPAPTPTGETTSGGTTSGGTSTTPTPTAPSSSAIPGYTPPEKGYGRAKTIAYVVAPFAIVAATYFIVRHNRKSHEREQATAAVISGCVERSSAGLRVMNEKDGNFYSLVSDGAAVMPGERMGLKGKKQKDSSGKLIFVVDQVTNDYGTCAASASR